VNVKLAALIAASTTSHEDFINVEDYLDTLVNRCDLILADMVGETTFIASIAELNAAIAALGVDIDAAIGASTAAILAGISADLLAQTTALVVSATSNTNTLVAANLVNTNAIITAISGVAALSSDIAATLVTISNTASSIDTKMDTVVNRLNAISTDTSTIYPQTVATNTKLNTLIANSALGLADTGVISTQSTRQADNFFSCMRVVTSGNVMGTKEQ
jgi:hypothetical protein